MPRPPEQPLHRVGHDRERGVDVGVGRGVAEAEPHRRARRAPARYPSRAARATDRSRPTCTPNPTPRTRRAGRARRATSPPRRRETRRQDAGDATRGIAVHDAAGHRAREPGLAAGRADRRCARTRRRAARAWRRAAAASPTMPGDVLRAGAALAFVAAAVDRAARARRRRARRARRRPSDRRTCAPRSRRGRRRAVAGAEVEPREGLHRVGVDDRARRAFADARRRRPRASGCTMPVSLLTSITETTAVRSSSAAASASRSTTPAGVGADALDPEPFALEPVARAEHRLVLDRGRDDRRRAPAPVARRPRRALHREVVGLAAAAGEHDLARRAAAHLARPSRARPRAPTSPPAPPRAFPTGSRSPRRGTAPSPPTPPVATASRPRGRDTPYFQAIDRGITEPSAMLTTAAAGSECVRDSVSHPEGILKT